MLVLALCATDSCRSVLGIEERQEATTDAGPAVTGVCGGIEYPTQTCASCMDENCCDVMDRCGDSPLCSNYVGCYLACANDDAGCHLDCAEHAGSVQGLTHRLNEVQACLVPECGAPCATPCGVVYGYGTGSCEACLRTRCCAEIAVCESNPECNALSECPCGGGNTECVGACHAAHPDGTEANAALVGCREDCSAQCAESDWGCLGKTIAHTRPKKLAPIRVGIGFVSFIPPGTPYAGMTVKACKLADATCAEPFTTGATDPSGWVVLTVPIGWNGFEGYFEVSGAGVYPTLAYFGQPIEDLDLPDQRFPSETEAALLAIGIGVTLDDARGHLVASTFDCTGASAFGVSVNATTADSGSTRYYIAGGAPSADATETEPPEPYGGFLNLPPGQTRVEGTVASLGKSLGDVTVIVREKTLTYLDLQPR